MKILIYIFILLNTISACGKSNKSLSNSFLELLNNYNKDSLRLITSDNFQLNEVYVDHTFKKNEFLDTFLIFSKAINGKFKIINIISDKEPAVYIVEDISDFSKYLKFKVITWKMTITTKNGKVEKVDTDTTIGFQANLADFIVKYDKFKKWLEIKYPNETESVLYRNTNGLFAERLKEYSDLKIIK